MSSPYKKKNGALRAPFWSGFCKLQRIDHLRYFTDLDYHAASRLILFLDNGLSARVDDRPLHIKLLEGFAPLIKIRIGSRVMDLPEEFSSHVTLLMVQLVILYCMGALAVNYLYEIFNPSFSLSFL